MLQLSIFLENAKGRLAQVLSVLEDLRVNIQALSLADTKDYGVLRLIVQEPEEAAAQLKEQNFVVNVTPVWVLRVEDRPGGLADVLNKLVERDVIVEYMYGFVEKADEYAQIVFHVRDQRVMEEAVAELGLGVVAFVR